MKNINGAPVTGNNFYGREKELKFAWTEISNGNNLILPSPRRVGKTSFAYKLLDMAKAEGWGIIELNLERYNEIQFIEELTSALIRLSKSQVIIEKGKKLLKSFERLKPTFTYEGTIITLEIDEKVVNPYKVIESIIDHEKPILIFVDELTILLNRILNDENGPKRVASLLHWLRDIRIAKDSKVRWVMCSSVGISNFAHTQGLSDTLNDVSEYRLRPFSKETSISMLGRLSQGAGLDLGEAIPVAIVEKLDYCIPYFLQIVFQKINSLHSVDDAELNDDIVEMAYNSIIQEKHFNTWVERIEKQYGEDVPNVFALLKQLCQTEMKRANLLDVLTLRELPVDEAEAALARLIYMLENDGYIIGEADMYMFRSPLIRDFWKNRFV